MLSTLATIAALSLGQGTDRELIISSYDFQLAHDAGGVRSQDGYLSGFSWSAPLGLAVGSVITKIEAVYYDADAADWDETRIGLWITNPRQAAPWWDYVEGTQAMSTPWPKGYGTAVAVDNLDYQIQEGRAYRWSAGSTGPNAGIYALIVTWHQGGAEALSTPLFSDVGPGHPFRAYIEALALSGITGGCGGGKYCPDAVVTRGQMAVFLSKGLGLGW